MIGNIISMYQNIVVQKKMLDRLYNTRTYPQFYQQYKLHGVPIVATEITKEWRDYFIDIIQQFQQQSAIEYFNKNVARDTIFFKKGDTYPPIINFIRLFAYQVVKERDSKINAYSGMIRWFRCYNTFFSESTYCDNEIYEDMNVTSCLIVLEHNLHGGQLLYEYNPSTETLPCVCCPWWDVDNQEAQVKLFPGLVVFWDGEWRHRLSDIGGKGSLSYMIVSFEYDLTK